MADRAIGAGITFPGNHVGRRIATWVGEAVHATAALFASATRPTPTKQHHPHAPRREHFVEEAAMRREMYRL